jgi:hypothetical protein
MRPVCVTYVRAILDMVGTSMTPTTYRLVVRGELDDRYAHLFEGMRLDREEGTTILTGEVGDQTKLYGLIERIEELGLGLLEVKQVLEADDLGLPAK